MTIKEIIEALVKIGYSRAGLMAATEKRIKKLAKREGLKV